MTCPLLLLALACAAPRAAAQDATWSTASGARVELPATWRRVDEAALAELRQSARLEALKPALGGEARAVRYGAFDVATWQRALASADLVLVPRAETSTAPASFARIFERSPDFVAPELAGARTWDLYRLRGEASTVTVAFHGREVEASARDALLAALEARFAPLEEDTKSRFAWLAWIPILVVIAIVVRAKTSRRSP